MQADAENYITLGVELNATLKGYIIARISRGEFGMDAAFAVIDAMGVDSGTRGHGLARALIEAVEDHARKRGVSELISQTDWSNQSLAGFFGHMGFGLTPVVLLERATDTPIAGNTE